MDAPRYRRCGFPNGLHAFKTDLPLPIELGEVTRSIIRQIRRLFQDGDVLLGKGLSDAQGGPYLFELISS